MFRDSCLMEMALWHSDLKCIMTLSLYLMLFNCVAVSYSLGLFPLTSFLHAFQNKGDYKTGTKHCRSLI